MIKRLVLGLAATVAAHATAFAADPAFRAVADPSVSFPDISHATLKQGVFPNRANLRMIAPGMTKDQVYLLLGVPHFHEGVFGVHRWNYILNFYTGAGDEHITCQFQIRYDAHMRIDGAWWKGQQCADLDRAPVAMVRNDPPAPVYAPPEPRPTSPPERSFVVYFAFDGSDVSAPGEQVLRAAAEAASTGPSSIALVSHTDTSGDAAYNLALSERRSRAVLDALVALGVPAGRIRAEAVGESDPAVPTADGVKEPLNRRTTLIIGS
ncbi:OmpA family protein [Caulobacter soli]|uniref:OmpA family protein n=1 Tax=Caulobacter soli TaxID=2708539 RepID=UPI0013E9A14F|nr:OmpA family protein [Caulobacter soli]